jgi:hypothetical protein
MTSRAHPTTPPRPLFETLPRACRAAIIAGNTYTDIRPVKWAETYACSIEAVKDAWEAAQAEISQYPDNTFEEQG